MKTIALLFLFSFFVSGIFSQNSSIGAIDERIEQIKSELATYEKVEKIEWEIGYKFIYLKDGDIKLISVYERDKIEKEVNWYFVNKTLSYTETKWYDPKSLQMLYSEKTYHNNQGNLIAWLNNESTFVDSSSPEFAKMSTELKARSIQIRNEAME